jgi:large subunit ribosomal protein L21
VRERYMYAVVEIGGRQMRVSPDETVDVPLLDADVGSLVTFDRVFAVRTNGDFKIGSPTLKGAMVKGTVVAHLRGPKVLVYKYKRRKFYRRKKGHRQPFTQIKISDIAV